MTPTPRSRGKLLGIGLILLMILFGMLYVAFYYQYYGELPSWDNLVSGSENTTYTETTAYYENETETPVETTTTTTTTTTTPCDEALFYYIYLLIIWTGDDGVVSKFTIIGKDYPITSSIPLSIGGTTDELRVWIYDDQDGSMIGYIEEPLYVSNSIKKYIDVTGLKGRYIKVHVELVNVDVGMYGIPTETVVWEDTKVFYVGGICVNE